MKKLLHTIFIFSSLCGFSQEKKGICSSYIHLFHDSGSDSIPDDKFRLEGFFMNDYSFQGNFVIDSTTWADTVIHELTLPIREKLSYSAYWIADGMCYTLDSANVNSLVTVLEGTPFPITRKGFYDTYFYYNFSQEGVIKEPCLFKIQRKNDLFRTYFFRVKFQDPPQPEVPLETPEIILDISAWLSNENILRVKTDETIVWNLHLYSLTGEVIQNNEWKGSQDLDISNLSKGCYIARFSSQNGLEKQLKFVK